MRSSTIQAVIAHYFLALTKGRIDFVFCFIRNRYHFCWKWDHYSVKDINECALGKYQEKCSEDVGKCNNTVGSWNCVCELGYINSKTDNQKCERLSKNVLLFYSFMNTLEYLKILSENERDQKTIWGCKWVIWGDLFCGIKDDCNKNTTKCVDLEVGYRCECLPGLAHIPQLTNNCEG